MDIEVSVLLPIYNAEHYLKRSLGNLITSKNKKLEFICINDGSIDNSLSILREYAKQDNRIVIINKNNSGYGHSMNEGLKIAKGKYIAILEPDDFCDNCMYDELYKIAENTGADLVKSNYYEFSQKTNKSIYFEVLKGQVYNQITNIDKNPYIIYMRPCIWTGLYRREFLQKHNIYFSETPGASYQDTAFAFKVYASAEKVIFSSKAYLHYCIDNDGSSVASKNKVFSICDEFMAMEAYLNQNKILKDKLIKILQLLKFDSYNWNLERISGELKSEFYDYMALDFIRADYLGYLDKQYFDDSRWNNLMRMIDIYKQKGNISGFYCKSGILKSGNSFLMKCISKFIN